MVTSSNGTRFLIIGSGGFPSQMTVIWTFDISFDVCQNKLLDK